MTCTCIHERELVEVTFSVLRFHLVEVHAACVDTYRSSGLHSSVSNPMAGDRFGQLIGSRFSHSSTRQLVAAYESEMDALIQSLAERQRGDAYARIRKLTERMGPMSEFGRSILTRGPEPMKRGKVYEYDQEPGDLVIAMQEVLDRRGQAETPPLRAFDEIVKREPYPVERKAKELVERLKRNGITRFLLLFRGSRSRSELVATFMAVLELCRNHIIRLAGSAADCTVTCQETEEE